MVKAALVCRTETMFPEAHLFTVLLLPLADSTWRKSNITVLPWKESHGSHT